MQHGDAVSVVGVWRVDDADIKAKRKYRDSRFVYKSNGEHVVETTSAGKAIAIRVTYVLHGEYIVLTGATKRSARAKYAIASDGTTMRVKLDREWTNLVRIS
jgi:hypothetical protein